MIIEASMGSIICMDIFPLISVLVALVAVVAYLNQCTFKIPLTIALTVSAMLLSLMLLLASYWHNTFMAASARQLLSQLHFHSLLLDGMLGPLLFAGSFSLDLSALKKHAFEVGILALLSTVLSAFLVTVVSYYGLALIGINMPLLWCALFGALISPTDPVAVIATFKSYWMPAALKARIAGESLFNDGVGIVLFVSLYGLLSEGATLNAWQISWLFIRESIFGLGYGYLLGLLVGYLGAKSQDVKAIILLSLAAATGGFCLAQWLGFSGALAMVSCGMTMRYYLKRSTKYQNGLPAMDLLWELIEDLLNAILFLLIGFELLTIQFFPYWFEASLAAILVVLLIRALSVSPVLWWFYQAKDKRLSKYITLFTWGGLRGGLAVALVLSLPQSHYRNIILTLTYSIVAFAVVVQGLSVKQLVAYFKHT